MIKEYKLNIESTFIMTRIGYILEPFKLNALASECKWKGKKF